MKTHVMLTLFLWCTATITYSQVGMTTNNPNKDAVLDLNNSDGTNTKGLLLPKVSLTSTSSFAPLTAHVEGMKVYNTFTSVAGANQVTPGEYYNDGSKWIRLSTDAWTTNGNGGTIATTNALGTKDSQDFAVKTNGTEQLRIAKTGPVLIGTSTVPSTVGSAKLVLDNGLTKGAIQIKDGTEVAGATLISDANGVATWYKSSDSSTGTGIYYNTVSQTFTSSEVVLQTSNVIKIGQPGNYLFTLRFTAKLNTSTINSDSNFSTGVKLNKNGIAVDLQGVGCVPVAFGGTGTIGTFTTFLMSNAVAGDTFTIGITRPLAYPTDFNWVTGSLGLSKKYMPSVIVAKM